MILLVSFLIINYYISAQKGTFLCCTVNWNHCLLWLYKVACFYASGGFPGDSDHQFNSAIVHTSLSYDPIKKYSGIFSLPLLNFIKCFRQTVYMHSNMHSNLFFIFIIQKWKWKWLRWQGTTPLWQLSAWIFARHWPAKVWSSPSLSTLALPSSSPWTPGRRPVKSNQLERGQAPQHWGGMQVDGKPFWRRKLNCLLPPWWLRRWRRTPSSSPRISSALNVIHPSNLKNSWKLTLLTSILFLRWKLLKRSVHFLQFLI